MRITLDKNNNLDLALIEISKLIKGSRFEGNVFAVGGYCRDKILYGKGKDLDLVVSLPNGGIEFAEWICKETDCYKKDSNPVVFTRFQTAKFNIRSIDKISKVDIETVCTRKEVYTNENSRKPDVEYGTIQDDAIRRDFTMNALYMNISTLEIIDPTNLGIEDIHNQIIRSTNIKNSPFKEDALRILRGIRFQSKLGWGIEKDTWLSMIENAYRIETISQERITDEINKILISERPSYGIRQLHRCGLLKLVLPEVYNLIGCVQGHQHFGDVFEHTMATLEKAKPIVEYRMAALLHDIAKPECKSTVNGVIHFFSHEYRGAAMANDILKRMKYSNNDIKTIVTAVKNHMRFKQSGDHCPSNKALRKFVAEVGGEYIDIVLNIIDADNKSHDSLFCLPKQVKLISDKLNEMKEEESVSDKIVLPINGNDIMEKFNMKSSPKVGKLLAIIKDKFLDDPTISKEECFKLIERELAY